ncbi:hypothetical protein [Nocardia seriolae]|uniref:hypothetical protein n=1 Tax=Nocardia seriolae TaxID=37332 RepID=UPI001E283A20|nr:hypothetical protein [Nocardia seriolae]
MVDPVPVAQFEHGNDQRLEQFVHTRRARARLFGKQLQPPHLQRGQPVFDHGQN